MGVGGHNGRKEALFTDRPLHVRSLVEGLSEMFYSCPPQGLDGGIPTL